MPSLLHLRDDAPELLLSDPKWGGLYGSGGRYDHGPLRVQEVMLEEVLRRKICDLFLGDLNRYG